MDLPSLFLCDLIVSYVFLHLDFTFRGKRKIPRGCGWKASNVAELLTTRHLISSCCIGSLPQQASFRGGWSVEARESRDSREVYGKLPLLT